VFVAVDVIQLESVGPDALALLVTKCAPLPDAAAEMPEASLLRAAGASAPGKLAGAIAGKVRDGTMHLGITGIGPAAVLRMLKAAAIASSYLTESGLRITVSPAFVGVSVDGQDRTGVLLHVYASKA
jgi:stage V sporulation protein SpoVS